MTHSIGMGIYRLGKIEIYFFGENRKSAHAVTYIDRGERIHEDPLLNDI